MFNECPIKTEISAALDSTEALAAALRKLKRAMRLCATCPFEAQCGLLADFNASFEAALGELQEEWNISVASSIPYDNTQATD